MIDPRSPVPVCEDILGALQGYCSVAARPSLKMIGCCNLFIGRQGISQCPLAVREHAATAGASTAAVKFM